MVLLFSIIFCKFLNLEPFKSTGSQPSETSKFVLKILKAHHFSDLLIPIRLCDYSKSCFHNEHILDHRTILIHFQEIHTPVRLPKLLIDDLVNVDFIFLFLGFWVGYDVFLCNSLVN